MNPFAAAIFVNAFLLFLLQPMFAKMALPHLGGSAAVWTSCVLFFQTALLAGYLYAHWLASRVGSRMQVVVHLGAPGHELSQPHGNATRRPDHDAHQALLARLVSTCLPHPLYRTRFTAPALSHRFTAPVLPN